MDEEWKTGWIIACIAGLLNSIVVCIEYRTTDKALHVKITGLTEEVRWDGEIFDSKLAALQGQLKQNEAHTASIMVQCKLEEMIQNAP